MNAFWVLVWSLFFGGLATLLLASMFSQKQSSTGNVTETVMIKSMTCTSDDLNYPFFVFDDSNKKSMKVVATFNGDNMRSIALSHLLYYGDEDLVRQSETENHANMNISFAKDGMRADALGANYAKLTDALEFSLYALYDDVTDVAEKFFLLDGVGGHSYDELKRAYESLGMTCVGENV